MLRRGSVLVFLLAPWRFWGRLGSSFGGNGKLGRFWLLRQRTEATTVLRRGGTSIMPRRWTRIMPTTNNNSHNNNDRATAAPRKKLDKRIFRWKCPGMSLGSTQSYLDSRGSNESTRG